MNHFNIYCSGHPHSLAVCSAVERGTGFPIVSARELRDGGVFTYGFLRGLGVVLHEARRLGRPWVYADRGYLGATYGDDRSGYFRATRDAYQFNHASGPTDPARWRALGLALAPWRAAGTHVVVCPPGDVFTRAVGGFAATAWLDATLRALRANTDRPIRVRLKSARETRPLADDLRGAHALVTYMSNTAVEAILAGVPAFVDAKSAAATISETSVERIESPRLVDDWARLEWAEVLASNQWTLAEFASGAANRVFA